MLWLASCWAIPNDPDRSVKSANTVAKAINVSRIGNFLNILEVLPVGDDEGNRAVLTLSRLAPVLLPTKRDGAYRQQPRFFPLAGNDP